ncbi:uncharacterized GPI-anchored protein At1g61900 isoform X2 [Lathyrus oleraceus]|uniref:uncharacterized GPI-anchored protein At1g61900 isoform X2 n=1 Tax=Pisum sativum TaxID=3888 RepID=UPI0021D30380|nr:uncharacterized GPI-anchored protein At1g61900-like isoform X2 [Pisum sativum]
MKGVLSHFLLQIPVLILLLILLFMDKSQSSPISGAKYSFSIRNKVHVLPYDISPNTQPLPFIPLLAPSPLIPFTNDSLPKLSGLCSLNFSAVQDIMTKTATNCWTTFAPYLANVVCCPQFDAMLITLIGQSSKYSGLLALSKTQANHCLSDIQKVLVSQGANENLNNICSVHPSNLTEGLCPVASVDEFESIADSSRLLTACREINPVNECCDQVCQNAIDYAARKIALNDMSNSNGNSSLPPKIARIKDCKNIILRWLAGKLNPSTSNSVFRGLSNCNLNKELRMNVEIG